MWIHKFISIDQYIKWKKSFFKFFDRKSALNRLFVRHQGFLIDLKVWQFCYFGQSCLAFNHEKTYA